MSYKIPEDLKERFKVTDLKSCNFMIKRFEHWLVMERCHFGPSQKVIDSLEYWIARLRSVRGKLNYEEYCRKMALLDSALECYKEVKCS